MEYKGYVAGPIDFDADDGTFSGTVAGIRAILHFEADNGRDLIKAFRDTVDDYLAWCAERGTEPERPFKGNILVRTDPELHRKAALRAVDEGISLNEWISRRIAEAA